MGINLMKKITVREVQDLMMQARHISIIDVREKEEVDMGIISGSIHIPLGELQIRVNELDKNQTYVIVCRSGNRSGVATQFLNAQGFDASNMIGGMLVWEGNVQRK